MYYKFEYIQGVLKSCFLPELKQDLDSIPIQLEHFLGYHQLLEHQLPNLFDFVQNELWIWNSQEPENCEVQALLLLLFSEISAPTGAVYKLQKEHLLKNAERILEQRIRKLPDKVDSNIFEYYQRTLGIDCWKRQLGAVHGFSRFLELRYSEHNQSTLPPCAMSQTWLTFCLSVGLNLRECHDPAYKQISTRVFTKILKNANRAEIIHLNIHCVIYDAVYKNVYLMDTVPETADIWNCLFTCMDFYDKIDSFSWSMADDMMETLLRNITLAPDALVSICLLKFVTKLTAYFSVNRKEIEKKLYSSINTGKVLTECRFTCAENSSYTSFRWAKCILQLFTSEAYKLMGGANICRQLLQEMHRCYMVCILSIPLQITQQLLVTFWDKFTATLMEVLAIHKQESGIIKLVKSILETFEWQLKCSTYTEDNAEMLLFCNSFEKLLKEDIFSK